MMETTHGLTYSVAKSDGGNCMAFCRCHLFLFPDSQFLSLNSDFFWLQWWGLTAAHVKNLARVLLSICFHAISIWLAVCAGPACAWYSVAWGSDDSHVHATGPHSTRALAQACPAMSCIHLVIRCLLVYDGYYVIIRLWRDFWLFFDQKIWGV